MATLTLSLRKCDPPALTIRRPDGSSTGAAVHPYLPLHDLMHLCVEEALGFRNGFLGLVADGWDLADFSAPGAVARLPAEAQVAETIVGVLDLVRAGSLKAGDIEAAVEQALAGQGLALQRPLGQDELEGALERHRRFAAAWAALEPGASLQATYTRPRGPEGAGEG